MHPVLRIPGTPGTLAPMMAIRRGARSAGAVALLGLLAACGNPAGATATARPSGAAGGPAFTNCGADTYVEPPFPRFTLGPGGAPPSAPVGGPVTDQEALSAAHQILLTKQSGVQVTGDVTCRAVEVPRSKVASYVKQMPNASDPLWVVLVSGGITLPGEPGNPFPSGAPSSAGISGPAIAFFISGHHPLTVYTYATFNLGLPPDLAGL